MKGHRVVGWLVASMVLLACEGAAQSLQWLGVLPIREVASCSRVSYDGSHTVGFAHSPARVNYPVLWSQNQSPERLGLSGEASDVSDDGEVVVGSAWQGGYAFPFRWSAETGMQLLPTGHPVHQGRANHISADKRIVVGRVQTFQGVRACYWDENNELHFIDAQNRASYAAASAQNGAVIFGAYYTGSNWLPFRWSAQHGLQTLPLPPNAQSAQITAVSHDGRVIVGHVGLPDGRAVACRWVDDIPKLIVDSSTDSYAYDVSADGSTVVGAVRAADGVLRPFRWNVLSDMTLLPIPDGHSGEAQGISGNGQVIVGTLYHNETLVPVRWETTDAWTVLPYLPAGQWSVAYGVSPDGKVVGAAGDDQDAPHAVAFLSEHLMLLYHQRSSAFGIAASGRIVGFSYFVDDASPRATAWRRPEYASLWGLRNASDGVLNAITPNGEYAVGYWRAEGVVRAWRCQLADGWATCTDLGGLSALDRYALALSADGRVVVGWAYAPDGNAHAFRWTESEGLIDLGVPNGAQWSAAMGVSPDGTRIAGYAFFPNAGERAFAWHSHTFTTLQADGVVQSRAYGVDQNGTLVGWLELPDGSRRAFRWNPDANLLQTLNDAYAALVADGSVLAEAYALSPDGRYIVGAGFNNTTGRIEGFVLDTWRSGDTNGDGCIDDADLLNVLFGFGGAGADDARHDDLNKDGIVDDADLLMVLFEFGAGC